MLPAQQAYHQQLTLMGCRFGFTAIHEDSVLARVAIQVGIAEIRRIEALISSWDPQSQTSEVNRQAGIAPVIVDQELYDLIYRSIKVSRLTEGAFDISFGAIQRIWTFDGKEHMLPPEETIAASVALIDYKKIKLDPDQRSVFLTQKGMKIGFGGIGKGYAAMRAKALMQKMGIQNGLVNASGDLLCWGKQQDGQDWRISIAKPEHIHQAAAWLHIPGGAVVTSGDYEKFCIIEGQRHAHIIDPHTGYPTTGIKSVSIICPDAELGDALATSIFVLGKERGLTLINQLKGIECVLITDEDEMITSEHIQLEYEK